MGVAYAWEKMSVALDALAVAPEALPARLKHALFPHFMNALHDAEQVEYLPAELLGAMRAVRFIFQRYRSALQSQPLRVLDRAGKRGGVHLRRSRTREAKHHGADCKVPANKDSAVHDSPRIDRRVPLPLADQRRELMKRHKRTAAIFRYELPGACDWCVFARNHMPAAKVVSST